MLSSAWGASHVNLLTDADATKSAIGGAVVNWLAPKEDANDTVFFFFSGHGNSTYLAPYDSLDTSYADDISYTTLSSWLGSLDSCGSGAYGSSLSKTGRVILTSCGSTEDSWDAPSLEHGVFSYNLLGCLTDMASDEAHYAADANRDHIISAEEIFDCLEPKVIDWANQNSKDQHPQLYDGCAGQIGLVTYKTRYYLTVESKYGVLQGDGWYDEGSTATFSVSGGTVWYRSFGGWGGDSDGGTQSSAVVMNGPITVSATWRTSWAVWAIGLGGGLFLILVAILLTLRLRSRRRRYHEELIPVPVVAVDHAMHCPRCGAQTAVGSLFCQTCGSSLQSP
jgi:hypothetical protein